MHFDGTYFSNNNNLKFSGKVIFSAYHTPSETRKYIYLKYIFANLFKKQLNITGQYLVVCGYSCHNPYSIKVINHLTNKKTN